MSRVPASRAQLATQSPPGLRCRDLPVVRSDGEWSLRANVSPPPCAWSIVSLPDLVGAGIARLDNADDLRSRLSKVSHRLHVATSQLELLLLCVEEWGIECVASVLGDFAFVAVDMRRGLTVAARDVFGVKPLFFSERSGALLISSRADVFTHGEYDKEFLSVFLLGQGVTTGKAVYRDVVRLRPGAWLKWDGVKLREELYWCPSNVAPRQVSASACREEFRDLFVSSVRSRVESSEHVWAELSGGVDTSSIVTVAQYLSRTCNVPPLAGTLSYVDSLGEGDERVFVDAVLRDVGIRNERVSDDWPWRADDVEPPLTDEPSPQYPFFARHRAIFRLLRSAGALALLGGHGADHYLGGGDYLHISDLLSQGHVGRATRAARDQARAWGTSFWAVAWTLMVRPFLPPLLRLATCPEELRLPKWIAPRLVKEYGLLRLLPGQLKRPRPTTTRYRAAIERQLAGLPNAFVGLLPTLGIDLRYPFLCRRVVEFALAISAEEIVLKGQSKVVLREALRMLLPTSVYERKTKGSIDARFLWSLQREHARLDALLHEPLLADLGCIDASRLRAAVDLARRGRLPNTAFLLSALALETWLAVRARRWVAVPHIATTFHRRHATTGPPA